MYCRYNSKKERDDLDLNTLDLSKKISVFPGRIYAGDATSLSPNYFCDHQGGTKWNEKSFPGSCHSLSKPLREENNFWPHPKQEGIDNEHFSPISLPGAGIIGTPISLALCDESSYTFQPNDSRTNYLIDIPAYPGGRAQHPDQFSRFAYGRFPNEYGAGNWSRGYNTPETCYSIFDVPQDMAPKRFYTEYFLNPFVVKSKSYLDGKEATSHMA